MKNFAYARADSAQAALGLMARTTNARFLGGGTNLVDLMRENIEQPDALIDVTSLPFNTIDELPDGGVSIGAAVKNTAVAAHRAIRARHRDRSGRGCSVGAQRGARICASRLRGRRAS